MAFFILVATRYEFTLAIHAFRPDSVLFNLGVV
jgi:hypothetical protein